MMMEQVFINVGPADINKLVNFMSGTAHAHLIDLVSYLVPVETEVTTNLIAGEQNQVGSLGADTNNNSYLGYTVYL
ncbi:hypothetical protein CS542_03325 [Pedobacter sp. IW39]|nr:hypothetical protein CS542_03325 [Pedobacter sp. IW39]